MTVSYRVSMADNWHQIKHLFTKTVVGKYLLVFLLAVPLAAPVTFYHAMSLHHTSPPPQASPSHHAAPGPRSDHLTEIITVAMVPATYVIILLCVPLGLSLGTFITPRTTITVEPEFLSLSILTTEKLRWKQFSAVAEEPDHFYFVGWKRAFLVPKRAFNSSAEAYAFFDLASEYWRKAKRIALPPPLSTSGVWPPAPSAEDVQGVGGTPKG